VATESPVPSLTRCHEMLSIAIAVPISVSSAIA
jgi:hypothetical protein